MKSGTEMKKLKIPCGTPSEPSPARHRPRSAPVEESSGNVFTDLGLPHPEQRLAKAHLTLQIYRILKHRRLTQAEVAKALGIQQPQASLLLNNRAGRFSVARLQRLLTALRPQP